MADITVVFSIDKKIKEHFSLFTGKRSESEDIEIYNQTYDLVFDELMRFVEERLTPYQKEILLDQIDQMTQAALPQDRKEQRIIELIMNSLGDHKATRFQLESRLHYYIDNL